MYSMQVQPCFAHSFLFGGEEGGTRDFYERCRVLVHNDPRAHHLVFHTLSDDATVNPEKLPRRPLSQLFSSPPPPPLRPGPIKTFPASQLPGLYDGRDEAWELRIVQSCLEEPSCNHLADDLGGCKRHCISFACGSRHWTYVCVCVCVGGEGGSRMMMFLVNLLFCKWPL